MPNYLQGKIYRIVCNQSGKQYIGSTTISLAARLSQHKKLLKSLKSGTSKQVLENNDYSIVLIEDYPCDRKELLLQRERFYIETMDCVNKNMPNRSKEDWYKDNRERLIEKQTIWNNNNKDKLREYQKTFKTKHNLSKGVYVDLTNIDVDENVKINVEDIYDCDELINIENIDKDILIDFIEKQINNNK